MVSKKEDKNQKLMDLCYEKSINVLKENTTPIGFSASTERYVNYYSVWARDHSITAFAAILSGDEELIKTSKNGLLKLLTKQIDHGQIPSYIEVENNKKVYGGLGSITSVDSNLWIVIMCAIMYEKTKDKRFVTKSNMRRYMKFYRLFKAFDSNDCGLLEIPIAGDWADIYGREYHILYDQCLYYAALKSLKYLFSMGVKAVDDEVELKKIKKRIRWVTKRIPKVKKRINEVLWFTKDNIPKIIEEYMIYDDFEVKDYEYYQGHIMPFRLHWTRRFVSFGNIMAMFTGVASKKKKKIIIDHIYEHKINEPYLIRCMSPPIFKRDKDWESIYRDKMKPYTSANGGIWPMIGGFLVYCLSMDGQKKHAKEETLKLAKMLKKQKWKFYEYNHGKTGKGMGRTNQCWTAAGYMIAYCSLNEDKNILSFLDS